ncbi:MAG: DNA glycosylase [Atopobiaceae bacterium]|nr:DNA glycosylase [Atopobiaceae bacterium]
MRIETSDFSLQAIAASGQVFTWQELPSGRSDARFLIASGRHRCIASQKGSMLTILTPSGAQPSPAVHAYWRHYFALDQDYGAILSRLPLTSEQLKVSSGIRVLAQDWWDVSVSFMISQNSNIPRIQHAVTSFMDCGHGLMPRPKQLKALLDNEEYAQGLKLGYRLPYLRTLAQKACHWQPKRLQDPATPLPDEMAELEGICGIGPKVASCICLYGLGYLEAVPRDTWIKKAERTYAVEWDPVYGGIQQQYIFAWMRQAAPAL